MKTFIIATSLFALAVPALAADVGISINIGQPNFYGRIDIGDFPPPRVIYEQPIIVERPRYGTQPPAVYLRVPPGHQKNWSKHCRKYDACGQRVYFVQDTWYQNDYAPRYREQHGDHHERRGDDRRGEGRGEYRGHGQREDGHDRRDDQREDRHDRGDDKRGERHEGKRGRD